LVTDLKDKKELKDSLKKLKGLPIKFVLGRHRKKDFINKDLIIKNPSVKWDSFYLKTAQKNNVLIKTDTEIFFDLFLGEIIGVTGTKGKSTIATLIYLLLKKKYPKNIFLAGNIGISPLEILSRANRKTKVVLELSSFALENLKKSPRVAVITNIFPDHLNRYKTLKDYIEAKKPIFKYQKKDDILILNKDNPYTKLLIKEAKSRVYFFSEKESKYAPAILVAKLYKVSKKDINIVISSFKGLSNRQEFIREKNGVRYYNDTAATTPQSTILAIKELRNKCKNIILIAGGEDKNLDYQDLSKEIKKNVSYLILLEGSASLKLEKELGNFPIFKTKKMTEAVKKAAAVAKKGDIVLLSPASASFNLFKNEFDRGRQFKEAVKKI